MSGAICRRNRPYARSSATRAPRPTRIVPVSQRMNRRGPGRLSAAPTAPSIAEYVTSQASPMRSKTTASCSACTAGEPPGAMNWGRSVRKKTPSLGLRRADSRPCSHARCHARPRPVVRAGATTGLAVSQGRDPEIDQVRGPSQFERGERDRRRGQEGRDAERSRNRPAEDAGADPDGRRDPRRPAVPKHVAGDEGHVRPGDDDDGDRNANEREQPIVHGPS